MAGYNIRVNIWRMSNDPDDHVGGSMITGSVVYQDVQAFMQEQEVEQLIVQQGLETVSVFNVNIIPGTLIIHERDEIEITQPKDHYYYGQRFRIMSFRRSSHNPRDPRNYILLLVTRSDRMHRQQ